MAISLNFTIKKIRNGFIVFLAHIYDCIINCLRVMEQFINFGNGGHFRLKKGLPRGWFWLIFFLTWPGMSGKSLNSKLVFYRKCPGSCQFLLDYDHNTFSYEVVYMATPSLVVIIVTRCTKNRNNSNLLSSTRRKSSQYWRMTVVGSTCLSLPLFPLAVLFKLSGLYTSQIKSTRLTISSWEDTYGVG